MTFLVILLHWWRSNQVLNWLKTQMLFDCPAMTDWLTPVSAITRMFRLDSAFHCLKNSLQEPHIAWHNPWYGVQSLRLVGPVIQLLKPNKDWMNGMLRVYLIVFSKLLLQGLNCGFHAYVEEGRDFQCLELSPELMYSQNNNEATAVENKARYPSKRVLSLTSTWS